nr:hypothetical protein GCM10020093_012090 [Planobispora longispora]
MARAGHRRDRVVRHPHSRRAITGRGEPGGCGLTFRRPGDHAAHDTSGLDAATSSANNQAGWAGVGWRWSGSRTSYNADGLVSRANDYGDTAVSTDNTCDTTTHARDPVTWMLGFPAARETPAARWSGSSGPVTTP